MKFLALCLAQSVDLASNRFCFCYTSSTESAV